MSRKDSKNRIYFSDPHRFTDLINGTCFKGKQVVRAEDLSEISTQKGRRTRDVVMRTAFGVGFAIIGEEGQETVDYSLPVRIMESDVADYKAEVLEINRSFRKQIKDGEIDKTRMNAGEMLYRFPRDARIHPVVTIVLSNAEKWDGPVDLTDMLDTEGIPRELIPYINGYRLNIIEIPKLTAKDTKRYHTDLKQVLDLLRCSRNGTALKKLIREDEAFQSIAPDAYDLMNEYINLSKYNVMAETIEGGRYNMKNGLDEIVENSIKQGHKEGKKEGMEQGIAAFIADKLEDGADKETIKDRLMRRFGLKAAEADGYINRYAVA